MKKVIIITESWEQADALHKHVETKDQYKRWRESFEGHYPHDKKVYNATWYWRFDSSNSLSGQSGKWSFENTIKNSPKGTPVYKLSDYINAINLPLDDNDMLGLINMLRKSPLMIIQKQPAEILKLYKKRHELHS